jgi:hypothetical protein
MLKQTEIGLLPCWFAPIVKKSMLFAVVCSNLPPLSYFGRMATKMHEKNNGMTEKSLFFYPV